MSLTWSYHGVSISEKLNMVRQTGIRITFNKRMLFYNGKNLEIARIHVRYPVYYITLYVLFHSL